MKLRGSHGIVGLALAFSLVLLILGSPAEVGGSPNLNSVPPLSAGPRADIGHTEDLGKLVPPRKPPYPKLDFALAQLAQNPQRSALMPGVLAAPGGLVRAVAEAVPGRGKGARQAIERLGGRIETSYGNLIQFVSLPQNLVSISELPKVVCVRRPLSSVPSEVVSEGVGVVGADQWHSSGIRGQGVKVGVLDGGFAGYQELLGVELPGSVVTRSFRADGDLTGGGEGHGTAVAEIIHDLAPDAQLYLVNFDTEVEMGNAVDWLIARGVRIINHSVGWPVAGPGDGIGPIDDIVAQAREAGVLWVNSAGNSAQTHWSGSFSDPDEDGWHNFAPDDDEDEGNTIYLEQGQTICIWLRWDDWEQRTQDFDLYLADSATGQIMAASENPQQGSFPPVEGLTYTAPESGCYNIGIYKCQADRDVEFDLFVDGIPYLEHFVSQRSILIPADSPHALAVGAVPWNDPVSLESFSSRGPTFDNRVKPDLVAPDGVTSATYSPFFGTSASAPHVAGAAALVKQVYPDLSPDELQGFLESHCLDLGDAGKDNLFGSGRLSLGEVPPGKLSGQVVLQGRGRSAGVEVTAGGKKTFTDAQGNFLLELPRGSYEVRLSFPGYLSRRISGVEVQAGEANDLGLITLLGGDVNGDETVSPSDLAQVALHFNTMDSALDINGDGWVDIYDLVLVGLNLGKAGQE